MQKQPTFLLEHAYHCPFQVFILTTPGKLLEDLTKQCIVLGVFNSMPGRTGKITVSTKYLSLDTILNVTSLTSSATSKESLNPTVTKMYSVSFTYDTELLHKK